MQELPLSWSSSWGDWPVLMELFLADDYGNPIQPLSRISNPDPDGYNLAYRYGENTGRFTNGEEAYKAFNELLRNNIDKNILIRCTHTNPNTGNSQAFHLFSPLKLRSEWKGSYSIYSNSQNVNTLVFEVNHLTDLYYRVLKKTMLYIGQQELALSVLDGAFSSIFNGAIFREFDLKSIPNTASSGYGVGYLTLQTFRNAGTPDNAVTILLRNLANEYSSTSVENVNTLIAEEVERQVFAPAGNTQCLLPWVCAAFLKYSDLLQNPRFEQGLSGWTIKQNLIDSATGYFDTAYTSGTNQRLSLSLSTNHVNTAPRSEIDISQTVSISASDLDRLHLYFRTGKVTGGSGVFGGFSSYSGISGIYFCVKQDNIQLGCWFSSFFTDNFTLPIYVGELYNPTSTNNFKYAPISNLRHTQIVNIGKIIRKYLPAVNIASVNQVSVGALVTESFGKTGDFCVKCFATVEVDELSLRLAY